MNLKLTAATILTAFCCYGQAIISGAPKGTSGDPISTTIGAGANTIGTVKIADGSGNAINSTGNSLNVFSGALSTTLAAWNSGTALNSTQTIFSNSGAGAALVHLVQTTTLTAGAITFEVSYDGTNWVAINAAAVIDPTSASFASVGLPYTVQASTNKPFLIHNHGYQGLRIKLSTAITGTGAVTPNFVLLNFTPAEHVIGVGTFATDDAASSATAAAVPASAMYLGGNGSGNLTGLVVCDSTAILDMTTATTTQMVALSSGKSIYVCSLSMESNGTTTGKLAYGTGTNCATGTTALTPNWDWTAQTGISEGAGGLGYIYKTAASNALCATNGSAVNLHVRIAYTSF